MAERYNFKYLPLVGKLPGKSMVEQTETAINELASVVYDNVGHVGNLAEEVQTANTNASSALDKATEALETSGRVYIKQIAAVDVNDYYDSELYYINNDGSTNIPVRDRGFLEVKTNDDKTACEQVFIADSTGTPYYRHGVITEQTLGEETTYVVTWGSWYRGATAEYVQVELQDYLPLSGGTITGNLSVTGVVSANAINTLQRNTAYAVGDIVYSATLGSKYYLECTVAGTTGATEPSFTTGGVIVDGTCTFVVGSYAMAGEVKAFAGNNTPAGWLLCDGSAVSRTTYARLFEVIGTTYGAGNGSSTFNLPNLTDKFIQGSATAGTQKAAGLPNITGNINDAIVASRYQTSGAITQNWYSKILAPLGSGSTFGYTSYNVDASASNAIYGNSTTVQPPALTMRYIIKY